MNVALKMRILESGKRQIQIAQEVGVPEPQFSKIVGGWINPPPEVKARVARVLKCEIDDIFPSRGDENADKN